MDDTQPDIYTVGQIAKLCHVAHRTVHKWIDSGRLPGHRIPSAFRRAHEGNRRVLRQDLLEFMSKHRLNGSATQVVTVGLEPHLHAQLMEQLHGLHAAATVFDAAWELAVRRPQLVIIDFSMGRAAVNELVAGALARLPRAGLVGLLNEDSPAPEPAVGQYFDKIHCKPIDGQILIDSITHYLTVTKA